MVAFDNPTSLRVLNYISEDFSSIGCTAVVDLTDQLGERIKSVVDNIAQHVTRGVALKQYAGVDLSKYNQILCLYLENTGKSNVISALNKVLKMDGIACASPDYKLESAKSPNDPDMSTLQAYYEAYNVIDLYEAWDISTGSENVRVGVLDSGIAGTIVDLSENLNAELCRDLTSWQSVACAPIDDYGHGTHVAGIIGGQGDNAIGGCGVCWDVELVPFKVLTSNNESWASWIIMAINYASLYNCDILNISITFQFGVNSENGSIIPNPHYNAVMSTAISNFDGLVVCAAGNSRENNDLIPAYPANYSIPNLITVGATNNDDEIWVDSNYGQMTVDIFAPGESIVSYATNGGFAVLSGTSMAAPFVTGVAALMLSVNPDLAPEEIKYMIMEGADDIPALANKCVSGGRLNALNALEYARDHSRSNITHNASGHTFSCTDCGFSGTLEHVWYMHSEAEDECVIKCKVCNYSFICEEMPEYNEVDSKVHAVNCPGGCYSFFEEHTWTLFVSVYRCADCGAIKD